MPELFLLDLIDPGPERKLDYTNHCDSHLYYEWEYLVAIPALKEAGYSLITGETFFTLEMDSFGPLSRGIRVTKDGVQSMVWYG